MDDKKPLADQTPQSNMQDQTSINTQMPSPSSGTAPVQQTDLSSEQSMVGIAQQQQVQTPQNSTEQNSTQPNVDTDTMHRHVPDLTLPQQVMSPYPEAVTKQPFSPEEQKQKEVPKKSKKGLPKPLIFLLVGFGILLIVFFLMKVLGSVWGGGSSGKVTLTYWGLWEDSNVMQGVISDFERQNPNIVIKYTKQDPNEYSKSVLSRIQNGTGPDIFRYHVSWLPMVMPSLLPLSTEAISKSDFTHNYYPVIQKDLIKNGAIYGIPLEMDTLALFINKKMFEDAKVQVPTTWDSFITVARSLTKKDATDKIQVAGAAMGTYNNITHAPDIISLLLVQNGVDLATMTPASNASDALTFYTSFAKDEENVWDTTLDPSLLAFERGKLAMYLGYSWDIFAIKAVSPDLDFAVYPVPHLPGRDTTIASYWVEGVSSKTAHPKEAMQFMHYLAQKDTETKLYTAEAKTRLFGEPYSMLNLASLLKNNALLYPFVSQATNASSTYFSGETQDTGITASMNQYLGNTINSVLKDTSADSAVETLTQGVSQVLNQYGQQ